MKISFRLYGSILVALLLTSPLSAAEWKPAKGQLMTRWSKDVKADAPLPEYPRPQMERKEWKNLNGLWQYATTKEGDKTPIGQDLPDQILVPYPIESALSGVMKHTERLVYRRTFDVPKEWAGKNVLLHFGAVDWEATVWVNGEKLGTHRGGYDGFSFDITKALKPSGSQEVIVEVFDPTDKGTQPRGKQVSKPEGIWYTPITGIWQTVWMEPVSAAHIESVHVEPDVDQRVARATVKLSGDAKDHRVSWTVKTGTQSVTDSGTGAKLEVKIGTPKLWTPESPYLYDAEVTLADADGKVVDRVQTYFGMRKIEIKNDDKGQPRIMLNGQPVFQVGPLDQGFWPDGLYTAPTDEALKYDIEITKKLGFNMTRKHVKVEPERWYYWCDKLGLLVWQDMPSGDRNINPQSPDIKRTPASIEDYEMELKALIAGRNNHPSIIMWVVFNEGWGQFDTPRITELAKKLDPSRLVNNASGWADRGVGDMIDMHHYPDPAAPKPEKKRASVLGEFGGLGLKIDGHTWENKIWGYRGTSSQEELTASYCIMLRSSYKLRDTAGLSAVVYTQITDVETECNGLLTYDREIIKVNLDKAAAANRGELPIFATLIPTAQEKPADWQYTTAKPADGWQKPDFATADWKTGKSGFGTKITPGAIIGTEWKTDDIWLRREIDMPDRELGELMFSVHHDEDCEIYINGTLAAKASGYISNYADLPLTSEGRAAIKPGKNILAVHCHQTTGGQYIDVGIQEAKGKAKK